MRKCRQCQNDLPVEYFRGAMTLCRGCHKAYMKEYRQRNVAKKQYKTLLTPEERRIRLRELKDMRSIRQYATKKYGKEILCLKCEEKMYPADFPQGSSICGFCVYFSKGGNYEKILSSFTVRAIEPVARVR